MGEIKQKPDDLEENIVRLEDLVNGFRLYKYRGMVRPGVSTATSHIVPKRRLEWHKKMDFVEQTQHVGNAASAGTEFHAIAQRLGETGETGTVPENLQKAVDNFKEFSLEANMTSESSEKYVFSVKYGYGGTYDRLGSYKGKRSIIDFKTGRYSDMDLIKNEAYRRAYIEMTGDYRVDNTVMYFPRDGGKPKVYTPVHVDFLFEQFLSCLFTWKSVYYQDLRRAGWDMDWLVENPLKKYFLDTVDNQNRWE